MVELPPTVPDWLQAILAKPACDIPEAGRALGINRSKSYLAAQAGEIPTLQFGRRRKVPTAWLRRQLQLDEPARRRLAREDRP